MRIEPFRLRRGCVWFADVVLTDKVGRSDIYPKFVLLLEDCSDLKGTENTFAAKMTSKNPDIVSWGEVAVPWSISCDKTRQKIQVNNLLEVRRSDFREYTLKMPMWLMRQVDDALATCQKLQEVQQG